MKRMVLQQKRNEEIFYDGCQVHIIISLKGILKVFMSNPEQEYKPRQMSAIIFFKKITKNGAPIISKTKLFQHFLGLSEEIASYVKFKSFL